MADNSINDSNDIQRQLLLRQQQIQQQQNQQQQLLVQLTSLVANSKNVSFLIFFSLKCLFPLR